MAGVANEMMRQHLFDKAKEAEEQERYGSMVACVDRLCRMFGKLSNDERNLLSAACEGSRKAAVRMMAEQEGNESDSGRQASKRLPEDQVTEWKAFSNATLLLIDRLLTEVENQDVEAEVFYHKMKGDYYHFLTEISEGSEKEDSMKKAHESYKTADEKAKELPATHPTRLGLALHWSVFHYEIRNDGKEACRVTKEAYDAAVELVDGLEDEARKESASIMQLLRDNLTLWTSEEEDQGEN
ncbi:YWHAZ [Branchiostoma lanceolatum]|uniref:YWHAZ protein n=1 Tax=Branchiostoma lanceolatum TaxID=7740 RepID=A0A8J9YW32_BRALA|nr:YWHAZ [Branchiostoma lanceolatum]